jgi:hypothetical protein
MWSGGGGFTFSPTSGSHPTEWAMPWESYGLLALLSESVTVKHHASRAGHGPGAV